MTPAPQLTLHLGHRVAMSAEDFLVADSNAAAVGWIDRWPDWPAPALVLVGPSGCGKTHLAQVWRARSSAALLPATALGRADPVQMLGGRIHCVVERPDLGVQELALLHLYNILRERGGSMLLTAEQPVARWPIALADLRSRLRAAPSVAIMHPDDALMSAIIAKLFADRQVLVGQEVFDYLLARMERSFATAQAVVDALDKASLAGKRPVTVALARDVLNMQSAAADEDATDLD